MYVDPSKTILHANPNHSVDKVKKLLCYRINFLILIFKSVRFPNLRCSSKYFEQIYKGQYRAAMLEYICLLTDYLGDRLSVLNKQAFT